MSRPHLLTNLTIVLVTLACTIEVQADSPDCIVVFNEVQYNPTGPSEDGEWIELFNQMGIKVDLSGWRLAGGIDFTFPAQTFIDPGEYLVIGKAPAQGQLGPFAGSMDNSGDRITLINHSGRLMDTLDFGDDGRWPVIADGSGATLAKRKPYTANKPPEHWTNSVEIGGTPGAENFPEQAGPPPGEIRVSLLARTANWRFHQSGLSAPANWATSEHTAGAGGWESGPAIIAYEPTFPDPIGTTLRWPGDNTPYVVTYYFETEFTLTPGQVAGLQTLQLRHLLDDGAVFYLNGVEVFRANMPGGAIDSGTLAESGVEAAWSPNIAVPTGAAVAGLNRISVEVHQETVTSGDIVFALELDALLAESQSGDVRALRLNEMPAFDAAAFWIELINTSRAPVELDGVTVSVGGDPLRSHVLPVATLGGGDLLLLTEQDLGLRPADGENVYLYSPTATNVIDGQRVTARLRGRAPSRHGAWLYPNAETPQAPNTFTFRDDIVISEIHYNPPPLSATPGTPATYDNEELFGFNVDWRYNDGNDDLSADWANVGHAVGGNWKSGPGPIGWESAPLSEPLNTTLTEPLTNNPYIVTYYFEREFNLTAQQLANLDSLQVVHQIDDGAVFYLNGAEARRVNILDGPVGPETTTISSVNNAGLQTTDLDQALGALVPGLNRISVEVHQVSDDSSDIVFGMNLNARTLITPEIPAQPLRDSDNQWIEIANRSTVPVNLGGWQFDDGISFTFPASTMLNPGEHACLAENAAEFTEAHPTARLLGEFTGNLSRSGERISLRAADRNPVDVVRFFDDGRRWPRFADGGGSSLELRDLDADNNVAEAWAPSDETHQSAWKTYSYRARGTSNGGPDSAWRDFVFGLLDAGEILLDDISVVESPDGAATQFLSNTTFESGANEWRFRGNHRHSNVITDPDNPGNKVLHIVAEGATEHMHNQIETTLDSGRNVSSSNIYEISFRAKWLTGSNQLHTRLYFNRAARSTPIDRPLHVGTPSAPNSRAESNIGPTFTHFLHSPAVPDANESVIVTAQASDPDGVTGLTLFHSVNESAFQSISMSPIGGGTYQATLPGRSASSIVQFYIRAIDGAGGSSLFPERGPDSRALYKVQDAQASGTGIHNFRIVMQQSDADFMHTPIHAMSNGRMGATVIDREEEIYYDVGVRIKGGQRARIQDIYLGFNVRFNGEQRYRGVHRTVGIDRSGTPNEAPTELMFDLAISNSGGSPSRYTDLLHVLAPRSRHTGPSILQMARYNDVFLDSQYQNGSDGHLYEYELIYYPHNDDANGFKIPEPDTVLGQDVGDLGPDKERYRWFFLTKNNRAADNFEPIIRYNQQFGKSGAAFEDGLEEVIDVDGWLRGFAYSAVVGSSDNIASGFEHNGMYYARPDGRVVSLPHDMDFSWNSGLSIFANPECSKLTQDGRRRRIYLGHLHDIISTTFNDSYMTMWSSHLNSLDPAGYWNSTRSYINSRASNVLSQINNSISPVGFNITTASPLTVSGSAATVSGDGWVNIRNIRVAGDSEPLPLNWTDSNSWQLTLPVPPGQSTLNLEALDFSGNVIDTDSIVVNNTTLVEPASAANVVISEIMYHPADPTAAEISAGFLDDSAFEYIEVMNIGLAPVELSGTNFSTGITFTFPDMILPVGGRAVVARNRAGFLARNPGAAATLVAGEYAIGEDNKLANGGETLTLSAAGGGVIRQFAYQDTYPWPESPDGTGASLVLIAPETNPDHAVASNWRPSVASGGAPGTSDATVFSGDPDADPDGNGLGAFFEYVLGSSLPPIETHFIPEAGTATVSFRRNLAADDVLIGFETSIDLIVWAPGAATRLSSLDHGDGTATEVWELPIPILTERASFLRLKLSKRSR